MTPDLPPELGSTLAGAAHIVALTGSGVSAESGVPTFRDAQTGIWAQFRPEELATPQAFAANPAKVWDWYAWRRELIGGVEPNAGHVALARLETLIPRVTLITQNVDGLHQLAGSRAVLEFHGNIHVDRCFSEGVVLGTDEVKAGTPPICRRCGSFVRPGVIWFGEAIDEQVLEQSFEACADCDVFISAGTSSEVYPAAGLAEIAKAASATVIEINPVKTPLSDLADHALRGTAATILPALVDALEKDQRYADRLSQR